MNHALFVSGLDTGPDLLLGRVLVTLHGEHIEQVCIRGSRGAGGKQTDVGEIY